MTIFGKYVFLKRINVLRGKKLMMNILPLFEQILYLMLDDTTILLKMQICKSYWYLCQVLDLILYFNIFVGKMGSNNSTYRCQFHEKSKIF